MLARKLMSFNGRRGWCLLTIDRSASMHFLLQPLRRHASHGEQKPPVHLQLCRLEANGEVLYKTFISRGL